MAGAIVAGDVALRNRIAEEQRGAAGAMARVDLVGSVETIAAFSRAQATLRKQWFELMSRGLSLVPLESQINELEAAVASLEGRHGQIVAALGSFSGQERTAYERFAAPHLIQLAQEVEETREELSNLQVQLANRKLDLTLTVGPAVIEVGSAVAEATLAARRELDVDLHVDLDRFRKIVNDRASAAAEDIVQFERNLRASLDLPKEPDES